MSATRSISRFVPSTKPRTTDALLLDAPLGSPSRPLWRGRLHLYALMLAIPMLVLLAIESRAADARASVIIYAAGLCSMLAVSTTYHRWVHTVRARAAWRRADHATIFAAIAGTFSALAMSSFSAGPTIALLVIIWGAAAVGAAFKVFSFHRASRLGAAMYIAVALYDCLLLGGGVLYTVGAVGFGRKWPTLRPATFSYHEVWHAFTIAAAGLHFAAVWTVAT